MKTCTIIILLLLVLIVSACSEKFITKEHGSEIKEKIDGYEWGWKCGNQEYNFTLWKENIELIYPSGDYWVIQGYSSPRGDTTKSKSSDESSRILIIYNGKNDSVKKRIHGKQIPAIPDVDANGEIINEVIMEYC